MNTNTQQSIAFPCLHTSGNRLIETAKDDFLRFFVKKHLQNNYFLIRRGSNERMRISWLIDRNGLFREVRIIRLRRQWLRSLVWFYDFTLIEGELLPGESMTVAQLLKKLQSIKSPGSFKAARNLIYYLNRQEPDNMFNADMFREFWDKHGPPLKAEQWLEQYPEM